MDVDSAIVAIESAAEELDREGCQEPNEDGSSLREAGAALAAEIERLESSRDFYKRRCEALQAVQDKMRDPERKAVCDILANGSTEAINGANA